MKRQQGLSSLLPLFIEKQNSRKMENKFIADFIAALIIFCCGLFVGEHYSKHVNHAKSLQAFKDTITDDLKSLQLWVDAACKELPGLSQVKRASPIPLSIIAKYKKYVS